jgi:hypothetical protein
MADWRANITALSSWVITGITLVDLDDIPKVVPRANLPLMFVRFPDDDRSSFASPQVPTGFGDDKLTSTLELEHVCLVATLGSAGGAQQHYPQTIDLLDAYLIKMASDPTLSAGLRKAMESRAKVGTIRWGQGTFFGFTMRLKWVRTVE